MALGKLAPAAELGFRGRTLALKELTRARAALVALFLSRRASQEFQGVRAGVLMGDSSPQASYVSVHLVGKALD